jgi:hypothetical protein
MASLGIPNLTSPDVRTSKHSFGGISIFSNHLAEAERQAAIAAEAGRQAGLHLARHLAEAGRQAAQEAAREREARNLENIENGKPPPLAHKFRRWCLNEMHISLSTGYKYVALGKIKIFRVGGCTMITDEESRRVLTEGVR